MPEDISNDLLDLLKSLLKKDPKERLGFKGDAAEIKKHPYFKDINFDEVRKK